MEKIGLNSVFIDTKSTRDFDFAMETVPPGEPCLVCVESVPGRGKTFKAQAWAAQHDAVYFRVASIWKRSELDFIQALCFELGIISPPCRKGRCYALAVERLAGTGRVVFVDEVQRLPKDFLNIVLDLSDATACPFVLIGEPELRAIMQGNKRVWSRTFQHLEFEPITRSDIALYAAEAAGIKLGGAVTSILLQSCAGDFRILRRDLLALAQLANAHQTRDITEEMARIAATSGLRGRGNGKK